MPLRILITGASRGFGAALSAAFAERGATVFAGVRGTQPGLAPVLARYPALVVPSELDVGNTSSVKRAAARIAQQTDALDVVVNNAAIRSATVSNPIETIDFDDAARTFDVNSIGPLRVAQAFLPLLRRGNAPILVNVSSEAGSIGQCGRDREFDYCMSKAALNMLSMLLKNYLKGSVRVLALHPGWLRTDMGGSHAESDPNDAARESATLIEREAKNLDGAPFLDRAGRAMPW
ncbi:MAG TPA: SDR family NAD(P)-dependent oxidoreductase [Polyangiaceae bacterium]|jgi:NAD(P)-dependent dehydrogenase (short-subunit alcohol dehydrogenase family)